MSEKAGGFLKKFVVNNGLSKVSTGVLSSVLFQKYINSIFVLRGFEIGASDVLAHRILES